MRMVKSDASDGGGGAGSSSTPASGGGTYSVILRFEDQDSADSFALNYHNRRFNSLVEGTCRAGSSIFNLICLFARGLLVYPYTLAASFSWPGLTNVQFGVRPCGRCCLCGASSCGPASGAAAIGEPSPPAPTPPPAQETLKLRRRSGQRRRRGRRGRGRRRMTTRRRLPWG